MAAAAAEGARQPLVRFEDLVIYFSPQEWAELTDWQRELYQDVMEDTFELVASLGSRPPHLERMCKIEQEDQELCCEDPHGEGAHTSADWNGGTKQQTIKEERKGCWSSPLSPHREAPGPNGSSLERSPNWGEVTVTDLGDISRGPSGWVEAKGCLETELLICGGCGRSFGDQESLSSHRALHEEETGPFACTLCGKTFQYRLNLLTHKKHRGKTRPSCTQCGLYFCIKGDLLRHRAGHAAEGLQACSASGRVFHRKAALLAHKAEHERAVVPHKCANCREAFSSGAELLRHRAAHWEERPFVCATCGASFSWKESLQVHQGLHAQERGYSCSACGKTFSRHGNLLAHQRLHTGELAFPCPECDRRFSTKASLVGHSRLHRRCRPFACPQCGRCFRFRDKLLHHQAESHGPEEVAVKQEILPV